MSTSPIIHFIRNSSKQICRRWLSQHSVFCWRPLILNKMFGVKVTWHRFRAYVVGSDSTKVTSQVMYVIYMVREIKWIWYWKDIRNHCKIKLSRSINERANPVVKWINYWRQKKDLHPQLLPNRNIFQYIALYTHRIILCCNLCSIDTKCPWHKNVIKFHENYL